MFDSTSRKSDFHFITAIGTPLDRNENLHEEGLEQHLADQWGSGIQGILIAGTMGMMQLLRDQTYQQLVKRAVQLSKGKGEILVGAGDAGLARTLDRVRFLNQLPIDGIVILTPYLFPFSQTLLTDYFLAIADTAERPVYLYDLPAVCHVSIDMDTYVRLAKHPNIYGAKISGRASFARQLIDRLGDTFRVIVAEPELLDVLLRHRVMEHLDGMFAIAPQWVMALGHAAMEQDWATAADYQQKITSLRNVLAGASSDMGAFTAMMNARGISGTFHPRPFQALTDIEKVALVSHPAMVELIGNAQRATVPEAKTFNAPAVR